MKAHEAVALLSTMDPEAEVMVSVNLAFSQSQEIKGTLSLPTLDIEQGTFQAPKDHSLFGKPWVMFIATDAWCQSPKTQLRGQESWLKRCPHCFGILPLKDRPSPYFGAVPTTGWLKDVYDALWAIGGQGTQQEILKRVNKGKILVPREKIGSAMITLERRGLVVFDGTKYSLTDLSKELRGVVDRARSERKG